MIDVYDEPERRPESAAVRAYIGILFDCCGVYARVYRRQEDSEYVGRCPRCLSQVRVKVGRNGISQRIFRAT